jgi:quercetin dioxygenase-like cupin family protein
MSRLLRAGNGRDQMAILHSAPGDVIDLRPLGTELASTRTHALFKSNDLELIRIVLAAGQELPAHAVGGDITLQCIEGSAEISCDEGLRRITSGELIYVPGGDMHWLRGVEDSSLLLTIALRNTAPGR